MSTQSASEYLLRRVAQAALEQLRDPKLYVVPAPPNLFLGAAHIELLQKDPATWQRDPGSLARVFEISRLVDCIQDDPGVVKTPDRARFLSHEFPQVLANVKFSAAKLGDDERQRYERALGLLYVEHPLERTPQYEDFCVLRADVEMKDVALGALRLQLARATSPEAHATLEDELALLEALQTERRQALDALDRAGGFRSAEAIVDAAERTLDRVPESVALAVDTMELFQISDLLGAGAPHVACRFFPASLSEDNWARLALTREELRRFGVGGASATSDADIDEAQIDAIELEVQTLVCDRHWFWPALFENPRWTWASPQPLRVSSGGDLASDDGLIPAYIHALTFARNLTVRGRPSSPGGAARPLLKGKLRAVTSTPSPASSLLLRAALAEPTTQASVVAAAVAPPPAKRKQAAGGAVPVRTGTAKRATPIKSLPPLRRAETPGTPLPNVFAHATLQPAERARIGGVASISLAGLLAQQMVSGKVVDENGRAVSLATLTVDVAGSQRRVSSGANGAFTLTGLRPGKYPLSVSKSGYSTARSTLVVPHAGALVLQLRELATCSLRVRLVESTDQGDLPFTGSARITLQSAHGARIENVRGPDPSFRLPAGKTRVSVASVEAASVTPAAATAVLSATAAQTLTFRIERAPLLQNPHVQLLAVVCRRLDRSPLDLP